MSKFKFKPNKRVDGPASPSTNEHAADALKALKALHRDLRKPRATPQFENIQDLITDLAHLADKFKYDFEDILRMAKQHWQTER